jgi:copper(I)-binding protein
MNRLLMLAAASAVSLAACERAPRSPEVQVQRAWIRLPAAPGGAAAGYFEARANRPGEAVVGASLPGARVEMHESMTMNHMSSMHPIEAAPFDAARVSFAPGGKHLMIFGLDPELKPGGTAPLTLRFKSAPPVTVTAKLIGAGDPPPSDGD